MLVEEALPVAAALAWVAVTGPVACSYSHLDSGHCFFELVVLASACPGVLASIHGCFLEEFQLSLWE